MREDVDGSELGGPELADADPGSQLRGASLSRLVSIMQRLLGPSGCPWDREQTVSSLRPYVLEEAFEVVDAVDRGEPDAIREELGDLLFQVVFMAELAAKQGWFATDEVIASICDKMIRRHPWVFGTSNAKTADDARIEWEQIKAKERGGNKKPSGALSGVPRALPALLRALRVGEKASVTGYDWLDVDGVRAKVTEELEELDAALEKRCSDSVESKIGVESEIGDVLFAVANLARKAGVDPEAALRGSVTRFTDRFEWAEREVDHEGKSLRELSCEERDRLWERAKDSVEGSPREAPRLQES